VAAGLDRPVVVAVSVLAVTQVVGWGTTGLLAIVGREVAVDLDMDIAAVFAGTSILYVVMGLWAPLLARPFMRYGARRVMIGGTILIVPGFLLLAAAHGPLLFFAAWVFLGTACSATLPTAANIMLNELAGRRAPRAISALMLATGLSSSGFWPISSVLEALVSWRGTAVVYAGIFAFVSLPLLVLLMPRSAMPAPDAASIVASHPPLPQAARSTYHLIVAAIAASGLVGSGFNAIFVELMRAEGFPAAEAVALGSAVGVLQVSARVVDFATGGKWDGVSTGIGAGTILAFAMVLLGLGEGSYAATIAFVVLYGLSNGMLAVARATIPLVYYDRSDYVRAASRMALPLNAVAAVAPTLFIALLTRAGSDVLLAVACLCLAGSVALLVLLARRRPAPVSLS
jgi:predicted MFS family arabinose efflux permease